MTEYYRKETHWEMKLINDKADALFEKKKYRKALRWYNQIPAEQASDEILLKMAECYFRTRQIDDCEMYCRKVLETNPDCLAAHVLLCKVFIQYRMFDKIEEEIALILSIDENESFAYTAMGFLKARNYDILGAIANYEKAIALDPNTGLPRFWLGEAYLIINQRKKGIEMLKSSFRINPTFAVFLDVAYSVIIAHSMWVAVGILLVLLLYLVTGVEEVMLISTLWFLLYGILAISARKYKVAAFQFLFMFLNLCTLMWVLG